MDTQKRNAAKKSPLTIGWREWVLLPDFEAVQIKAKVDTGARSSSLHAFDIVPFHQDGALWVRFNIHPLQRRKAPCLNVAAAVIDQRLVRSSSGDLSERYVIRTRITLLGSTWPIELTLANRDEMGFRMLLGREAFRSRMLVDAARSFYNGRPKRKKILPPTEPPSL